MTRTKVEEDRICSLPNCWAGATIYSLPSKPSSQTPGPAQNRHRHLPGTPAAPPAFPDTQLPEGRSGAPQPPRSHELHLVSPVGLFLWRTPTDANTHNVEPTLLPVYHHRSPTKYKLEDHLPFSRAEKYVT